MPVDSVTCRTSSGTPKKAATTGVIPSRNPSAMLPPSPATLRSNQLRRLLHRGRAECVDEPRLVRERLGQAAVYGPVLDPPESTADTHSNTPVNAA